MTEEQNQLRFVAAALAMQSIVQKDAQGHEHFQETASKAVKYADALLLELSKPRPTI